MADLCNIRIASRFANTLVQNSLSSLWIVALRLFPLDAVGIAPTRVGRGTGLGDRALRILEHDGHVVIRVLSLDRLVLGSILGCEKPLGFHDLLTRHVDKVGQVFALDRV